MIVYSALYRQLFAPRSQDQDSRRRELILNILLAGLNLVAYITLAISAYHNFGGVVEPDPMSVTMVGIFAVLASAMWVASRKGYPQYVSYLFLILVGTMTLFLMLAWGFRLPIAELSCALLITIAGVLFTSRIGLVVTGIATIMLLIISLAQIHGVTHPDTSWLREPIGLGDAIGYILVLSIIGLVSWLSNREIDRSNRQLRRSERALQKERDNLEIKVMKRTRALEEAQLARSLELQSLAELGRLSASLLHEVANPLTAASLNLEQSQSEQYSTFVAEARNNLHYLQRYITAARTQLRGEARLSRFSTTEETQQVIDLLQGIAKAGQITLKLQTNGAPLLYGDTVKFSKIVANLISNAIQAYPENHRKTPIDREVIITLTKVPRGAVITVQDFGQGIKNQDLPHIFKQFYTKYKEESHMGLGLATVKQFVEQDFAGSIVASSNRNDGTTFTAILHSQARQR